MVFRVLGYGCWVFGVFWVFRVFRVFRVLGVQCVQGAGYWVFMVLGAGSSG